MAIPDQTAAPPPADGHAARDASIATALGVAAATAVPVAAGVADALTVTQIAQASTKLLAALAGFQQKRGQMFDAELRKEALAQQPTMGDVVDNIISRELGFEATFLAKQKDRVQAALGPALAIQDADKRNAAVKAIFTKERKFTQMREEAMRVRVMAAIRHHRLEQASPQGAYWLLGTGVKQHTPDCLAMANSFWPWPVLHAFQPPVHHGCACHLMSLHEAVHKGLMTRDQVPAVETAVQDATDRLRKAAQIMREGLLDEEDIEQYLQEVQWDERYPKGTEFAGRFRPRVGGNAGALLTRRKRRALRDLMPDGHPLSRSERGRWTWIGRRYVKVPHAREWKQRINGQVYTSPAGTTNLFAGGAMISGSTDANPRVVEMADRVRAHLREPGFSSEPLSPGDTVSKVLSLPQRGLKSVLIRPKGGRSHLRKHINFETGETVDAQVGPEGVEDVSHDPAPVPSLKAKRIDRPPKNWAEFRMDTAAFAHEIADRNHASLRLRDFEFSPMLTDHAGATQWDGTVIVGEDAPRDLAVAAAARKAKRPLTDRELRGVYASYRAMGHEIAHSVNPLDASEYHDEQAALEEALAEEEAHLLAHERLAKTGQFDVIRWASRNPDEIPVAGVYLNYRGALADILDHGGLKTAKQREDFITKLKFGTPPEDRFKVLGDLMKDVSDDPLEREATARSWMTSGEHPRQVFPTSPSRPDEKWQKWAENYWDYPGLHSRTGMGSPGTTPPVDMAKVRGILKKAGVPMVKKHASRAGIRGGHGFSGGFTNIDSPGASLEKETDFRRVTEYGETRKKHVPTGRVKVSFLANDYVRSKDTVDEHERLARQALTDAGYQVSDFLPRTILVSAPPSMESPSTTARGTPDRVFEMLPGQSSAKGPGPLRWNPTADGSFMHGSGEASIKPDESGEWWVSMKNQHGLPWGRFAGVPSRLAAEKLAERELARRWDESMQSPGTDDKPLNGGALPVPPADGINATIVKNVKRWERGHFGKGFTIGGKPYAWQVDGDLQPHHAVMGSAFDRNPDSRITIDRAGRFSFDSEQPHNSNDQMARLAGLEHGDPTREAFERVGLQHVPQAEWDRGYEKYARRQGMASPPTSPPKWKKLDSGGGYTTYAIEGSRYGVVSSFSDASVRSQAKGQDFTGRKEWAVVRWRSEDERGHQSGDNLDWFPTMREARAEAERLHLRDVRTPPMASPPTDLAYDHILPFTPPGSDAATVARHAEIGAKFRAEHGIGDAYIEGLGPVLTAPDGWAVTKTRDENDRLSLLRHGQQVGSLGYENVGQHFVLYDGAGSKVMDYPSGGSLAPALLESKRILGGMASPPTSVDTALYHVAPSRLRDKIAREGLHADGSRSWPMNDKYEPGLYAWKTLEDARRYRDQAGSALFGSGGPFDIWKLDGVPGAQDPYPASGLKDMGYQGAAIKLHPNHVPPSFISLAEPSDMASPPTSFSRSKTYRAPGYGPGATGMKYLGRTRSNSRSGSGKIRLRNPQTGYEGEYFPEEVEEDTATEPSLPPDPGTTPIPKGNVRLWHYTGADPEQIKEQGLRIANAKGESYGEPNQIWASGRPPSFDNHNVVEFSVPRDDPRWDIGKYEDWVDYGGKGTAGDPNFDYGQYVKDRDMHVTFRGDIKPDEILAVHEPWHQHYRYLMENYPTPESASPTEFDWALDPNKGGGPDLAKAVKAWKAKLWPDLQEAWSEAARDAALRNRRINRKVMYHQTLRSNREDIERHGLKRRTPVDVQDPDLAYPPGVYMWSKPEYADPPRQPPLPATDIWEVDVTGLPVHEDEHLGLPGAYYHPHDIPPERLRRLGADVQEAWSEAARAASLATRQRRKAEVKIDATPYRGTAPPDDHYFDSSRWHAFQNHVQASAKAHGLEVRKIEPVRGVWAGSGEPSAHIVVCCDAGAARKVADEVGSKFDQDAALTFQRMPGGKAVKYVSKKPVERARVEQALKGKMLGATIRADGHIEMVDPDGGSANDVRDVLSQLKVPFSYHRGHAELREAQKDYTKASAAREGAGGSVRSSVPGGRDSAGGSGGGGDNGHDRRSLGESVDTVPLDVDESRESELRDANGRWTKGSGPVLVKTGKLNRAHLDEQEVEQHLLGLYQRNQTADKDAHWYDERHAELERVAKKVNVDPEAFTAMVAATSPQMAWEQWGRKPNLLAALKAVELARMYPDEDPHKLAKRLEHPGMLKGSLAKALAIYKGENAAKVLHGPKVRSFFNNLEYPNADGPVTIDTHMARAILGSHARDHYKEAGVLITGGGTGSGYGWASDRITAAARKVGLKPHEFQAAVWTQVRRELT